MRTTAALGLALAILTVAPMVGALAEFFSQEYWAQRVQLSAGAEIEGEPTSDDRVETRIEAGGESGTIILKRTPARIIDEVPWGEQVRAASPMGPVEADLQLDAGPVVLEGPGNVSPAFPLHARVAFDEGDDVDRTWLRLDGERWASLERAGLDGDREIWLTRLPAGTLPAQRTTTIDVVFERDPAPGTTQWLQGPGWDVHADASGPAPPELTLEQGVIRIAGQAERFEAQTRSPGEAWQPASVSEQTVEPVSEGATEVRARGVDELGNAGSWSPTILVGNASQPERASPQPFELVAPSDGATVEGTVEIAWEPEDDSPLVEVYARPAAGGEERTIGQASEPPIRWRTGFVTDGDWDLRIRAHQEDGWSSRLLTVSVDNLAPEHPLQADHPQEEATAAPDITPRTRSPLSAVLASGAGFLALTGLVGRAWKRRPK